MRNAIMILSALALTLPAQAATAQRVEQTSKYTLMIVAGGTNDGSRRDGVAMGGSGVYPGRQECEAAGAGIKYGVVNPSADQPPPTITWVCVPLGRP